MIELGSPIHFLDEQATERVSARFAAGVLDSRMAAETRGPQHGIQINLMPMAARALFGVAIVGDAPLARCFDRSAPDAMVLGGEDFVGGLQVFALP